MLQNLRDFVIAMIFKWKYIGLLIISGSLSHTIYSQTDSLRNDKVSTFQLYYNSGFGFGSKGLEYGLGLTYISSGNWGLSLSYKVNMRKIRNIPDDYFDDGHRIFAPRDYLKMFSLNLLKEFTIAPKSMKFGVEAGPSWLKFNDAQIFLNSSYDPNASPFSFNNTWYKYNKSRFSTTTYGLFLRTKVKFDYKFTGFEIAAFTDFNNIQPVFGIEFYILLGKMGNKFYHRSTDNKIL